MQPDPFVEASRALEASGLGGALPLRYRSKYPPPSGMTGRGAPYPTTEQAEQWRREGRYRGIALRLSPIVLGLDFDMYGDKLGRQSMEQLLADCGPLGDTWMVTSRTDGSGIRLVTVPLGVVWAERQAGPGVELVHAGHRYVVAPPSIHPEGRQYRWIAPDGTESPTPPRLDQLTALPASWGRRLSVRPQAGSGQLARTTPVRSGSSYAAVTFDRTIQDLAALGPGGERNWRLNKAAYKLGGLVGAGLLDAAEVRAALFDAAGANGHLAKHGERRTYRSIDSGLEDGQKRPRTGVAA